MSREGEPSPSLVRRTTTPYVRKDGRTLYYTGGSSVSVITSPEQALGKWYRRVTDWVEKLLKWVERVEGGPSAPRERPDNIEAPVETTRNIVLTLRVMVKGGHVLVLLVGAGMYVAYLRIKHLFGVH
jgi:hypothetical protein